MPRLTALERFGRLLPRSFRERVFEPAVADLVLTNRANHRERRPGALAQLSLIMTCLWVLVLQIAWQQPTPRRPLRVARNVVLLLVVTWYVILRIRYGHAAVR